eukprot:413830-Rhodomonas_salina.1
MQVRSQYRQVPNLQQSWYKQVPLPGTTGFWPNLRNCIPARPPKSAKLPELNLRGQTILCSNLPVQNELGTLSILWQAIAPGPKYRRSRIKMQVIPGACKEPTEPEACTHTVTMLEDPQH